MRKTTQGSEHTTERPLWTGRDNQRKKPVDRKSVIATSNS